eukprot:Hpha_TRINITY_DN16461_c2_g8::TRINITY_DN16461_c2_g8_i2::g.160007::m.160007/K15045/RSAD2; radical S-adenosyl methionine domain-containing protein 2
MTAGVEALNPFRWKVFQALLIEGENTGTNPTGRQAENLAITTSAYEEFLERHSKLRGIIKEEPNETMRNSYLILDERLRFLNNTAGTKRPTPSILDVGVAAALQDAGFDEPAFRRRDGEYAWNREEIPETRVNYELLEDIEDVVRR